MDPLRDPGTAFKSMEMGRVMILEAERFVEGGDVFYKEVLRTGSRESTL